MRTKKMGKRQAGQGLVEYALILVLVAVVAIGIIGLTGLAVQRVYGVIAAVMGAKKEETGVLTFNYFPQCGYKPGQGTGLYAEIETDIPAADLTVSTDTGFITNLTPMTTGDGFNAYAINVLYTPVGADLNDLSVCPHGLIVQTSQAYGGTSALYPVKLENWPTPP